MTNHRSGDGPDGTAADSWATETLPLSVRKELLERELKKLGFRKQGAQGSSSSHEGSSSGQQQGQSSHPQADAPSPDSHGE